MRPGVSDNCTGTPDHPNRARYGVLNGGRHVARGRLFILDNLFEVSYHSGGNAVLGEQFNPLCRRGANETSPRASVRARRDFLPAEDSSCSRRD